VQLGDRGVEVRAWQEALIARGHAIAADGDFGKRTHNATLAFQAAYGLSTTGIVGSAELQILHAPPTASVRPPPVLGEALPFIEARHYLRTPRHPRHIVLHSMEAPEASSRAEACAQYFARGERIVSAHYCVDSDSAVQCVDDHWIAYHAAGANQSGIGIEHAGYARQSSKEWLDDFGRRMLSLSIQLAARLCRQWNIPAVYVSASDLRLRKPGITTHAEVSLAFGKSDHHDPGPGFPTAWYTGRVSALLVADRQGRS
jgi:N-acetyl-anhydromuramyl-L-alanine amidase AmpD